MEGLLVREDYFAQQLAQDIYTVCLRYMKVIAIEI